MNETLTRLNLKCMPLTAALCGLHAYEAADPASVVANTYLALFALEVGHLRARLRIERLQLH